MNYLKYISLGLAIVLSFSFCLKKEKHRVYSISEENKGWIVLIYNIEGGIEHKVKDNMYLIPIGKKNIIHLSSDIDHDWFSEYFLWGSKLIEDDQDATERFIWGRSNGVKSKGDDEITFALFFLGSEKEYNSDKKGYELKLKEAFKKFKNSP